MVKISYEFKAHHYEQIISPTISQNLIHRIKITVSISIIQHRKRESASSIKVKKLKATILSVDTQLLHH